MADQFGRCFRLGAVVAALFWWGSLSAASACGAKAGTSYIIRPRLLGNHVVGELRIGEGIACYRDGVIGPPSFLVADIGKPGVPTPPKADFQMLRREDERLAPQTLRFVYLPLIKPHLVVFNAPVSALCDPDRPPFKDFTGACNQYYSPLEGMDRTTAAMDCD